VLVANGEIYNFVELREELQTRGHRFSTCSDCEVILHAYSAYGLDFLPHLAGMFAFALYDRPRQRLILARDRLGIKPLFLAHLPQGLAFASELKALFPLFSGRPEIDPIGLVQYLQNQFNSGRTTILRDVERVLPGEALWLEAGQVVKRWHYWSALDLEPREVDYEHAEAQFDGLMETVMRQHMRADVPFGLFLSGGVDSSVLLALLSRYSEEPIRTFSVGFQESPPNRELVFAERTAQDFSSRHTVIRPHATAMLERFPYTVWAADDLMRDYANLPTALLAQEASRELKVVFSGEGGDEVFAGYGRYRASPLERWVKGLISPGSGGFRTSGNFRGPWPARLFGPTLQEALRASREPFVAAWQEAPRSWTDLQRMQYTDITTSLPDNLLVKLDRMLMGWGVEGRVPFLDHRVVEFGLALPDRLKVNGKQGKWFLKRWASRFLPQEQVFARKRGFHVPLDRWLNDDFYERLKRRLPHHPAVRAWFQPEGIQRLVDQGSRNGIAVRMLWALLQFTLWYAIFIEGRGERPAVVQDPLELIA
jgi:asparagine synthase (glutamine-hydrolysing)